MLVRLKNFFLFHIESVLLRGPHYRLLIVALIIVAISLTGGCIVHSLHLHPGTLGEGIWWSFLRLTDPGYLGDDQGYGLRFISTCITVLGYVIFLGALVAIMTQWFQKTMDSLESATTPISTIKHFVILGWSNKAPTIVKELISSEERVAKFLKRSGISKLKIAILSQDSPKDVFNNLSDQRSRLFFTEKILVRHGDPLRLDHLKRVNFLESSAILIPASELSSPTDSSVDGETIKILMTIENETSKKELSKPPVIIEVTNQSRFPIARYSYSGPLEVILSDKMIAQIVTHNLRNIGLSHVYKELLANEDGSEIYLFNCPSGLVGQNFQSSFGYFTSGTPIGIIKKGRPSESCLMPDNSYLLKSGDKISVVSESYKKIGYNKLSEPKTVPSVSAKNIFIKPPGAKKRILVLGWNHRTIELLHEFNLYHASIGSVAIISRTSKKDRDALVASSEHNPFEISVTQIAGDYTSESVIRKLDLINFDSILITASDCDEPDASTDARTILGFLVTEKILKSINHTPNILVELLDPENEKLLANHRCETIVTPVIISHILTQVALRNELNLVIRDLFSATGAEIMFVKASEFFHHDDLEKFSTFQEMQQAGLFHQGCIIGIQSSAISENSGIIINPLKKTDIKDIKNLILIVIKNN